MCDGAVKVEQLADLAFVAFLAVLRQGLFEELLKLVIVSQCLMDHRDPLKDVALILDHVA